VATTRAADYLVLSSGIFDLHAPSSPWMKLLAERFDLESGRCLATLPKGYAEPAAKVTDEPPETDVPLQAAHTWHDLDKKIAQVVELAGTITPRSEAGNLASTLEPDLTARRRFSVSRLSGVLQSTEAVATNILPTDDEPRPSADGASDLGTLVHAVLAKLDFAEPGDIASAVRHRAEMNRHSLDQHIDITEKLIQQFLKSPRAKELASAKQIHRELEFLLVWPPQANPTATENCRYLQGFIDCNDNRRRR
jgi:ATP-dependent helicase/nuclease subunit A